MPATSHQHDAIDTTAPLGAQIRAPNGLKIVIGFFYFHLLLVMFPAWSFFQYDVVAAFHLEEPRVLADEAVVQTNRAIGLTNLFVVIPLNLMAVAGLMVPSRCSLQPPLWGMVSSYMILGVALYWPTLFLATRCTYASADIAHIKLGAGDATTAALVIVVALWSTWYLSTSIFREVDHQSVTSNLRAHADLGGMTNVPPEVVPLQGGTKEGYGRHGSGFI
jgi:hypothetical protein